MITEMIKQMIPEMITETISEMITKSWFEFCPLYLYPNLNPIPNLNHKNSDIRVGYQNRFNGYHLTDTYSIIGLVAKLLSQYTIIKLLTRHKLALKQRFPVCIYFTTKKALNARIQAISPVISYMKQRSRGELSTATNTLPKYSPGEVLRIRNNHQPFREAPGKGWGVVLSGYWNVIMLYHKLIVLYPSNFGMVYHKGVI